MPLSIDRISGLPDDVICHILSFLPTKTSVSTDILAKRWRFLWTHVPHLYFDEDYISEDYQFLDIINRVIALHRAKTINTFHVSGERVYCSRDQMAAWVTHATSCGVRNLHIDLGDHIVQVDDLFTLPRCLLTSNTLVDLKIHTCRWIPSSTEKVILPSLKKLHLIRIMYEDDAHLPLFLSSCPVLEDLTIECCYKQNLEDRDWAWVLISSPTIKILNVDLSEGRIMLNINAPSLGYLNVKGCYLESISTSVWTTTSLVEASFTLGGDWDDYEEKPVNFTGYGTAVQLLNCLCKLKCLKISDGDWIFALKIKDIDSVVKFDNLTKVEFLVMFDFHDLLKFLEVADNLKHLSFTLGWHQFSFKEPKLVPMCILSSLKTVKIHPCDHEPSLYGCFFEFNEHDFETIKYVLRNAQVLEMMEFHSNPYCCPGSYEEDEEILEKLDRFALLERGSESCQIVFC